MYLSLKSLILISSENDEGTVLSAEEIFSILRFEALKSCWETSGSARKYLGFSPESLKTLGFGEISK